MLPFAFAFIAAASANDSSSANLLPGARATEAGAGSIGVSATAVSVSGMGVPLFGVDATWAPTDRLALSATGAGFVGADEDLDAGGLGIGFFSARYLLVDRPVVRFAPFLTVAIAGASETDTGVDGAVLPTLGASLEAGNKNVWFDASVPLLSVVPAGALGNETTVVAPLFQAVFASELGVNGRIAEHHTLRLGLESLAVNGRYRYEADRWYVGGSVTAAAVVGFGVIPAYAGSADAGIRF
ncbi:hypothetical protein LBMAG42_08910 [Deltaproteobacteria bacterium]|nr:hypothetical protein LBMAG42_08910 [Deltaproteobacteria bacterium]